jgi:hypothetical protein
VVRHPTLVNRPAAVPVVTDSTVASLETSPRNKVGTIYR